MTMSVTNFASVWPELKNRESRSTDSNTFASLKSRFFSLTMAFANSRTSDTTARRRFSDSIPRALLSFHTGCSNLSLSLLICTASSKATANLASGREGRR
ncbi:hypothetical protein ACFX15_042423 [Malus domestica]